MLTCGNSSFIICDIRCIQRLKTKHKIQRGRDYGSIGYNSVYCLHIGRVVGGQSNHLRESGIIWTIHSDTHAKIYRRFCAWLDIDSCRADQNISSWPLNAQSNKTGIFFGRTAIEYTGLHCRMMVYCAGSGISKPASPPASP